MSDIDPTPPPSARRARLSLAVLAVSVALIGGATATAQDGGTTLDRTGFGIHAPGNWNGKLVIWLPDVTRTALPAFTTIFGVNLEAAGPLAEDLVAQGYAVARTTYQTEQGRPRPGGYGAFTVVANLRRLIDVFEAEIGVPGEVLLYGEGVGGLNAVQAVEKGIGADVTGALAMCAPLAGSRKWDFVLDLRLAYDVVCSEAGQAAQLPGGATGLPENDPDFSTGSLGGPLASLLAQPIDRAVNACTGVDQAPKFRSAAQQRALDRLVAITTRPAESLQRNMFWATAILHAVSFDEAQLAGAVRPIGNQRVEYPDAEVDADIERVKTRGRSARKLRKFYTPRGKSRGARVLALHTDLDGENVVEHLGAYADSASPEAFTAVVVAEREPSHCGFTDAERLAAWETLVGWAGGGARPDAGLVQEACQVHADARTAAGPCRIDPDYEIGALDDRILAR